MMITVKYLASLSEYLNKEQDFIELKDNHRMTVKAIWDELNPQKPIKNNTICAINHQYAKLDNEVNDGAELAFFPPVTGG